MMGLYYADGLYNNPYVEYLKNRHPHTSYITGWEHEVKSYIHSTGFEIIFLEIMRDDAYSKATVYRMAAYARQHSPESVIIIHGNDLRNDYQLDFPAALYDLFITWQMSLEELAASLRTLVLRSLFFICNQLPPRNLRGILCMREPEEEITCANYLHALGITTTISASPDIITRNIASFQPDFIVLHQHSREHDYDVMKQLCRDVKASAPACSIFITGNIMQQLIYKVSKAPFDEFAVHYTPHELLLQVLEKEQLKYTREEQLVQV